MDWNYLMRCIRSLGMSEGQGARSLVMKSVFQERLCDPLRITQ